jgi:regulation of enolase protein 1 (concanavalin A-like superfamily)
VYQPSSGNCSIQADVLTVENSGTHAKGGVMIRETLGTNAIMADVDVTPSKGVEFIWRTSTGGNAASTNVASVTAPIWVQVTRTGSTFVGSYSTNGTAWIPMATNTFTMASNANIGLVVCAYNNATNCTATFTNVTVNP